MPQAVGHGGSPHAVSELVCKLAVAPPPRLLPHASRDCPPPANVCGPLARPPTARRLGGLVIYGSVRAWRGVRSKSHGIARSCMGAWQACSGFGRGLPASRVPTASTRVDSFEPVSMFASICHLHVSFGSGLPQIDWPAIGGDEAGVAQTLHAEKMLSRYDHTSQLHRIQLVCGRVTAPEGVVQ